MAARPHDNHFEFGIDCGIELGSSDGLEHVHMYDVGNKVGTLVPAVAAAIAL